MLVLGFAKMRVSPFKLCGILLVLGIVASCVTCMVLMHTFHVLVCVCNSTVVALGTLKGPLDMARVSVMRRVSGADSPLTGFTGKDIMHGNIMNIQQQMQFLCDTTIPDVRKFPPHDSALHAITSYFRGNSTIDQPKLKQMFRKMSLEVHPDRNPGNPKLAQQAFICLEASYKKHTQLSDWQQEAMLVFGACLSFEEKFGMAIICISFVYVQALKAKKWVMEAQKGNRNA